DQHFGHCEFYSIYTIESNKVTNKQILESPKGCGCKSNIAYDLAEMNVKVMLAGGIGNGAVNVLKAQNIEVIRNCSGDVDVLVNDYLAGKITDGGANCAAHDEHQSSDAHVCNH
ncbi:MAG: NifB/NifX family molybdenum-iron cluster-binding protein, partial [Paludibacter sp.]